MGGSLPSDAAQREYEVAAMSLETNKIAAAVLTAGVIAMTSGFIAGILVHPHKLEQSVYKVAGLEQAAAPAAAAPVALEPIGPLLASADLAAGERLLGANQEATMWRGVLLANHALQAGGQRLPQRRSIGDTGIFREDFRERRHADALFQIRAGKFRVARTNRHLNGVHHVTAAKRLGNQTCG